MNKPLRSNEIGDVFRQAGVRLTPQRQRVYQLLVEHDCSYSIAEAVELLSRQGIGQATVYRAIPVLEQLGLLARVHSASGENRYVAVPEGHFHAIVCQSCGAVARFEGCMLDELAARLVEQTGFELRGHRLELFGLCEKCKAKK